MMPVIDRMLLGIGESPAASLAVKATLAAALGLSGAWLARRHRAALRHALLASAFAVLLALPAVSLLAPPVRIAVPANAATAPFPPANSRPAALPSPASLAIPADRQSALSLPDLLLAAWLGGAALFLLPLVIGAWQVRSLRRSALPWREGQALADELARHAGIRRPVELLVHASLPGPMTCGVFDPAIVLPEDARAWDAADLDRAIVHELEHVRRADRMSQCLARAVCALYWFHPLVWMAWRRLALEAERACDDAVLGRSEATAYADQLVGLARRLSTAKAPLLAMADRADLATRVGAVLDGNLRRGRAGRFAVLLACATAAALLALISPLQMVASPQNIPVISARFQAESELVILDVIVKDSSGNPIPGLTAKDFAVTEDGKPESVQVFDYEQFKDEHNLISSYYVLGYYAHNTAMDGAYRKIHVTCSAANVANADYRSGYFAGKVFVDANGQPHPPIRTQVRASAGSAQPAADSDPGITPPQLISKVEPAYSEEARKAKYQGTVVLNVQVDETGKVTGARVVRSLGLGLDEKAVEAVQKWKFKPASKDGAPIAVQTQVEVNFRLL